MERGLWDKILLQIIILNQGPWSLWAANWIPAALYSQHLWLSSRMILTFRFLWKYRGRWKENTLLTNWITLSGMLTWGVVYLNNSSSSVVEKLWIWLHKSRKYASKIFVQICDAIYIHSFSHSFNEWFYTNETQPSTLTEDLKTLWIILKIDMSVLLNIFIIMPAMGLDKYIIEAI